MPCSTAETSLAASAEPAPDYEAHFTLGIAYKNMGLYEDAMDEFHVSKSADSFYLDACLMAALCLKDQRAYAQAIRGLEAVLSDPRCQGAKGQAIRYELGMLYEAESEWGKAVTTYQMIPAFHDVPQRLESLRGKASSAHSEFRVASPTPRLTGFSGPWPPSTAAIFSTQIIPIFKRAFSVADPRWGNSTTFESCSNPDRISGSRSYTSNPAPAIVPCCKAPRRAASSMTGPRDVLIRKAVDFIFPSSRAPMRWRVVSDKGRCNEMKSLCASTSSIGQ